MKELSIDLEHTELVCALGFELTNLPLFSNMLRNGARVEVHGTVSLERFRSYWSNETLAEVPFSFFLRHDPLTREFLLQREGGGTPPLRYKKLRPLLEKGFSHLDFALGPKALLEEGESYILTAVIGARHLPGSLPLGQHVFFKSATIVPEVSVSMNFEY